MDYLISTFSDGRKWAKIVGIIFIVMFALQLFSGISGGGIFALLISAVIGVLIYLLPGLMLLKYAKAVDNAESSTDPVSDLEEACIQQGKYFQFVGIAAAIALVLFVIGIVMALFLGVNAARF